MILKKKDERLEKAPKKITILGSTGSIGKQTLEVIEKLDGEFEVSCLATNGSVEELEKQVRRFKPRSVALADNTAYKRFVAETSFSGNIYGGESGLLEAAAEKVDVVVSSIVGYAGLKPTLVAIEESGAKNLALANKETLVVAGKVVTARAKERGVNIIPIDSEHSAILQCLAGERMNEVDRIILTASGGPFRFKPIEEFGEITLEDALDHPNWDMGAKITIDSATMMNKGFEVIEAHWLFDLPAEKIDVLIHPQSIAHSLVEFADGSVKAQLGLPDMRAPISYALTYPRRRKFDFPRLDLSKLEKLSFFQPDYEKFRCLKLAYEALETGGAAPAVLNAANEVAVYAFLDKKIKFEQIPLCVEETLNSMDIAAEPSLDNIIESDDQARAIASVFLKLRK